MTRAVLYFGTYDPGYPRSAVAITGLRELGVRVYELQVPLPSLTAAEMTTARGMAHLALALLKAHGQLAAGLRSRRRVDAVVVGYPGHFLVPLARAAAALLRCPLVFDPLVSLWDTFAGDRGLLEAGGWKAQGIRMLDLLAFRLPDLVLADTLSHASYFRSVFALPPRRLAVMRVGALPQPEASGAARQVAVGEPLVVFQYGKWSPMHGTDIVLAAAERLRGEPFRFVLAGEGQLSDALRALIRSRRLVNVEWLGTVTPHQLRARTLAADVCLGVFGGSEKAGRVIPNKVYDALSCGRPVVTGDTPGARELLKHRESAMLVTPGEPGALVAALEELRDHGLRDRIGREALRLYERALTPAAVAGTLIKALDEA